MNQYVTGSMIKVLREKRGMTQLQLAEKLNVSDKTISKWETGRGYPDISILETLAASLGISVLELISGEAITNKNRAFDMKKTKVYVCPVCGNVILSSGEAVVSCCGITLPALEAEAPDENHSFIVEKSEDEYFVSLAHEMSKKHYISFIAAIRGNGYEMVKLYPESNAEARFKIAGTSCIFFYCNKDGLFSFFV